MKYSTRLIVSFVLSLALVSLAACGKKNDSPDIEETGQQIGDVMASIDESGGSGGALRVTNNQSGTSCDYVPSNVTWRSMCNCATSGTWSGSCSDGTNTSVTITGCGSADITIGSQSQSFEFDRCAGI